MATNHNAVHSKLFFLLVLFFLFLGCSGGGGGGNDDPDTVTGRFIDDPVAGINYNCSSGTTGVTNASGEYTCNIGDDVTFSIGPVTLGTLSAQSAFITPYSLFPGDNEAAINLAKLLQSVDSDGDPFDGVITLDEAQLNALPANTDFSDPGFQASIEAALGITLVDTMTAMNHLNDAIILNGGDVPDGSHIPVADAGADQEVVVNTTATLDGSGSYDLDGETLSYSWSLISLPSGANPLFTNLDQSGPLLTPDVEGSYVARLIVSDGFVNSLMDTVTITAIPQPSTGGAPGLSWIEEVVVHTSGNQQGGIAIDGNNNLYLVAEYQTNATYQDIYVRKYDASGVSQWTIQTGTATSDLVEDAVFDRNNNVLYIVGHTSVSLHDQPPIGDRDIFLIKYDPDGTRLWTIMDGTAQEDRGMSIAIDSSGNIYITGYTVGGDFDGNGSYGGHDIFVAKYNSDGGNVWKRQLGGTNWDRGYAIAVDSNDDILVTGYTASTQFNGQDNNGSNDAYIIKYNSAGTLLWTRLLGTTEAEYAQGIAVDSSNNIYVAGNTLGDMDGNVSLGGWDAFLTKYTSNGAFLWTSTYGGEFTDSAHDVIVDSSDGVYMTGQIGNATSGSDMFDYYLVKYDASGSELWDLQHDSLYGNIRHERGYHLALDTAENIFVNGTTYGSFVSVQASASNKVFVAKYGDALPSGGPYSVGGTVTGAIGTFTLTNNGGDNLLIEDNGAFVFDTLLPDGASYNVEILDGSDTSQGHLCTVVSGGSNGDGSGVIDGADVTDIIVNCVGV